MKRQVVGSMSEWSGVLKDFWRQVDDGSITLTMVKNFVERRNPFVDVPVNNAFLRRISNEPLIIGTVGGCEVIADAKEVFAYIDSNFKNWRADEIGEETAEAKAVVYEMIRNGNFAELFGSINRDPRKLCFTQEQIIFFCVNHRYWLRADGYATFFLFESRGQFFVANVDVYSDGSLYVYVYRFENSNVWDAEFRLCVVVPQLALS